MIVTTPASDTWYAWAYVARFIEVAPPISDDIALTGLETEDYFHIREQLWAERERLS